MSRAFLSRTCQWTIAVAHGIDFMKIENKDWEDPVTPRAVLCELLSRSRLEMVEDLEEGETPPLYVNERFAQALIAEVRSDEIGKYQNPKEVVAPPYFSFCGVFIFVRDNLFPKAKNDRDFYIAAFKRCV
jgi:hypothetical protein